jgi:hypothetical protein
MYVGQTNIFSCTFAGNHADESGTDIHDSKKIK